RFEAVDLVEGGIGGLVSAGGVEGNDDLEGGGHRPPREAEQDRFLGATDFGLAQLIDEAKDLSGGGGESAGTQELAAGHATKRANHRGTETQRRQEGEQKRTRGSKAQH